MKIEKLYGALLKQQRKLVGLTQAEANEVLRYMARATNDSNFACSPQQISAIEKGEKAIDEAEFIYILKAYQVFGLHPHFFDAFSAGDFIRFLDDGYLDLCEKIETAKEIRKAMARRLPRKSFKSRNLKYSEK